MRFFPVAMIGISLTTMSCTTVREYPRCFLFRAPTSEELSKIDTHDKELISSAMLVENVWSGRDALYVKAVEGSQTKIEEIWAGLGCVNMRRPNPFVTEPNDKWVVLKCQEYLDELIRNDDLEEDERIPAATIAEKYRYLICH